MTRQLQIPDCSLWKHPTLMIFVLTFLVGLCSAERLDAQVRPKKLVFISSVGGAPPGASSSAFDKPVGVAIGATAAGTGSISGTVYVADPNNNRIVVFPSTGATGTLSSLPCPNGVRGCFGAPWQLNAPTFVAAAPNGNLWISDTGNDVVVEVDPSGKVVAFAGAGPSGVVCAGFFCRSNPNSGQGNGQFFGPGPLAVDFNGNLYVADAAGDILLGLSEQLKTPQENVRIQKFAPNGAFSTAWGSFCTLTADGTEFSGSCNGSAAGANVLGDGQLSTVTGIAVDSTANVYVSEEDNHRVQKFNSAGRFLLSWGRGPGSSADGQFGSGGPSGVAVDLDQTIYVTDISNNRIQVFDSSGNFISKGGSTGMAQSQFRRPVGIAAVPPSAAFFCSVAFDPKLSDCIHGIVVSEIGSIPGAPGNSRVQFLAGRYDTDKDGITDEVDTDAAVPSTDISNASLGFTTTGKVISPGDQTFTISAVLSPTATDTIAVETESFGGPRPLSISLCGAATFSFPAGTSMNAHCSTSTVVVVNGPVGFQFSGSDGTTATATLNTGDSISFNKQTSTLQDIAGNIVVHLEGSDIALMPGKSLVVLFAQVMPLPPVIKHLHPLP